MCGRRGYMLKLLPFYSKSRTTPAVEDPKIKEQRLDRESLSCDIDDMFAKFEDVLSKLNDMTEKLGELSKKVEYIETNTKKSDDFEKNMCAVRLKIDEHDAFNRQLLIRLIDGKKSILDGTASPISAATSEYIKRKSNAIVPYGAPRPLP